MVIATTRVAKRDGNGFDKDELLRVLLAVKKGDFSVRMPATKTGLSGKIADTLNSIIESSDKMAREFEAVSETVGKEGESTLRVQRDGSDGDTVREGAPDYLTKGRIDSQLLVHSTWYAIERKQAEEQIAGGGYSDE